MDDIASRTAEAAQAEADGDCRRAARLYNQLGKDINQLGKDIQARHGRFDPRALDAFEGVARSIRKSAK